MNKTILIALLALLCAACDDRYRYPCQDPKNFGKPDCQRPICQFTQQCPDYLVAPILEKQITASEPQK
jgi:hypothetical protein